MIELNEGEVICDKCDGEGLIPEQIDNEITIRGFIYKNPDFKFKMCDKCCGFGKLDWIENVVGKTRNPVITIDSSFHVESFKNAELNKHIENMADSIAKEIDKSILTSIGESYGLGS